MNIPWIIVLFAVLLILLGILWGPTTYIIRKKKSRTVISTLGVCILAGELLLVAILVLGAEYIGLINPGGIMLASIFLASAVGGVLSNVVMPSHS